MRRRAAAYAPFAMAAGGSAATGMADWQRSALAGALAPWRRLPWQYVVQPPAL